MREVPEWITGIIILLVMVAVVAGLIWGIGAVFTSSSRRDCVDIQARYPMYEIGWVGRMCMVRMPSGNYAPATDIEYLLLDLVPKSTPSAVR